MLFLLTIWQTLLLVRIAPEVRALHLANNDQAIATRSVEVETSGGFRVSQDIESLTVAIVWPLLCAGGCLGWSPAHNSEQGTERKKLTADPVS